MVRPVFPSSAVNTVGRLGGDEFIILLGGLREASDARPVVKNIMTPFHKPFKIQGHLLNLTVCVGISVFPEDGDTASQLLRCADSAMYHAKKLGRNSYSYFTHAMNRMVARRLVLEEQMSGAMERGEFTVSYQPQIDVNSGRALGAEALLRWHNPEMVTTDTSPEEFIPLAEQTGLIVPLGQFVLTTALELCAQLQRKHDSGFRMSVNLSPRQFRNPELLRYIEKALASSGLSGESLELEITEGVLMSADAYTVEVFAVLRRMGVSLSMDDFGTGYSSLSYLRTYPFDVLKIDQSFIRDITINSADQALVQAASPWPTG